MTDTNDPLAVIAIDPPAFSDGEAIAIAKEQYGLDVTVRSLVSERDQNFHLLAEDGQQYVLKIASSLEPLEVTDFQIQGLIHIADYVARYDTPISAPIVQRTLNGESHSILSAAGGEHVVRIVSYVEGEPIGDRQPTVNLCRSMGSYLAHLGAALQSFEHPGSSQLLIWDLQQALRLRDLLKHIPKENVRQDVAQALNDFEQFALPNFTQIRRQVIHSDFNLDNVLIDPDQPDIVVGVIDFGDMLEAPLIADVAIGASYARPQEGDPLALMAEFIAAYHRVTPLTLAEIDILFELIKARLCTSITLLYWRVSFRDADDPYLEKVVDGESFAEHFLAQLTAIPREHAIQSFRQVCASEDISTSG